MLTVLAISALREFTYVWNRAVPGNTRMELKGLFRLVGVEGTPLKFEELSQY